MELYTLDALNRRQYVIDTFISLIWTERFQVYGDFELDLVSTYQARTLLKKNTWLAMNKSNYIARVESVEGGVDDTGVAKLTIKGRMIEGILTDRVYPASYLTGLPAALARQMFHDICVTGLTDAMDAIPGIVEGTFMPASTIAEPADSITITTQTTTLYDAMGTNVLAPWDLGMRILREDSTGLLYFDVYSGSDRTTGQAVLTPVVFAPQFDNLQNTTEITTIDTAKNVAYVYSPGGFQKVYAPGVDSSVTGFDRRVLFVDASDITTDNTANIPAALLARGNSALAAARTNFIFDGEISQYSQYQYGKDYNLGDLVELWNEDGVQSDMRVTEQIFSEDATGERSYPTLANYETISVGSWLAQTDNKTWDDLDADETAWADEP